jgi:hypothetical protein
MSSADDRCEALAWKGCIEEAQVARARLALQRSDATGALSALGRVPEPLAPETELFRAQVELALGQRGPAHARFKRVAEEKPEARAALDPAAALDWAHALLRVDRRALAAAALDGVPGEPAAALRKLAQGAPEALAAGERSFGGALSIARGPLPSACIARGSAEPVVLHWRVGDGFAPDERYLAFVHAYGPGRTLFFDHPPGHRDTPSLQPGEQLDDPLPLAIPADAPPGEYALEVGLYEPESGVRLHPRGLPGHISFETLGRFEVCP